MRWISKLLCAFRLLYVRAGFSLVILTVISCRDVGNGKSIENNLDKVGNDSSGHLNEVSEIDLYPYDTLFNHFLPDTSLSFSSNKLFKEYLFEESRTMDSALGSWQSKDSIQTFVVKRTAQIKYADYAQT